MLIIKQLLVAIDSFFFVCFFIYENQWLPATVWLPTFFKISSFVINRWNADKYRFGGEYYDKIVFYGWTMPLSLTKNIFWTLNPEN